LYTVEIPRADAERYLVFRERGGKFELIDDFAESRTVKAARDVPGGLEYTVVTVDVLVRKPALK
jgi:hypothetical protein